MSQKITVHVKDEEGKALDNINVQLVQNNKTLDFRKTNSKGVCVFEYDGSGELSLKFTSIFYKTKILELPILDEKIIDVILQPQITEIKEVEIKSRPKIGILKGDTISFNLKAVKDGTERTAEDLIKKIPGLDITDKGKVTYQGSSVGQILIDGNDFFGKNHKMATQNISADMIEGVDLWKNFTTLNGEQSSALNLKLKEEYKGRITGSIEGYFGNKGSYLGHTNLFKFGKLGNLALIADVNSIAKNPIDYLDFVEMSTYGDLENSSNIDIPSFLNNDGRVQAKSNQFGALQYSKSTKKLTVSGFSIFNFSQLNKFTTNQRTVFDLESQNFNFYEENKEKNKGFLGGAQLKIKRIFSDNSFLYYDFGFHPGEDNFNQNIDRYSAQFSFFKVENSIKTDKFNNFISWNKQIDNTKFILSFNHVNESYDNSLDILSNENLFQSNINYLIQNYGMNSHKFRLNANLQNKNKWFTVSYNSGFLYKKDVLKLKIGNDSFSLNTDHFFNDINLSKQIGDFHISGGVSSHLLNINAKKEKDYFEKKVMLRYLPKSEASTEFNLEYSSTFKTPTLNLLQDFQLFNRNLTSYQNSNLFPDLLSNSDTYKFSWNRFSFKKRGTWFFMLNYTKDHPVFTTNASNYGNYSEIENVVGGENHKIFLLFSNDQAVGGYFYLKSRFTGLQNKTLNYIDRIENISTIQNYEISQKLSSNIKSLPVQFELGYIFTKGSFKQSLFQNSSSQQNLKLALGLRSTINKEWIGNVLTEYLIQKTQFATLKNFLIGGQLSYKKKNSDFEYNLIFNNILNLNSFTYINSYTSQLGVFESSTAALHGYIIGGMKFHF
ncbi:hypothetical protein ACFQO9_14795 [Chryseobacterium zhengzhouense]|uniref:TonB-dependent receptor n=1 Tax=Chryseobacterium zhengzhouense TaxID=1636086 RepID=A0ABW2LZG8_9FLAO